MAVPVHPLIIDRSRRLLGAAAAAVPVVWAVVVLLHPAELPFDDLGDDPVERRWVAVHLAQLVLAPALAILLLQLLRPLAGAVATTARCCVVVWLGLFSAFDAIAGIATGVLSRYVDAAPVGERPAVAHTVKHLFIDDVLVGGDFGSILAFLAQGVWALTAIVAFFALRDAGRAMRWGMLLSVLFTFHAGPPAALGLLGLAVAFYCGLPPRRGDDVVDRSAEPVRTTTASGAQGR